MHRAKSKEVVLDAGGREGFNGNEDGLDRKSLSRCV